MNDSMRQITADLRFVTRYMVQLRLKNDITEYLHYEMDNLDPICNLSMTRIRPELHIHGIHHIPFKTAKWQEWWGEAFYRRDGNDTPKSPIPEVAELQDLFAGIKRKHQKNHRQWRHELAEYLLRMEAMHPGPPKLSDEYEKVRDSFNIQFKTDEYQNWWNLGSGSNPGIFDDDRYMPCDVFSPFEKKFVIVACKIHMAIYERRLDEAQRMISELLTMVDEDRANIANSIASGVLLPARL